MSQSEHLYYRQCVLKADTRTLTAWLPEMFAKKGKYVTLKADGSTWQVAEVGFRLSAYYLAQHERDYIDQRKASDI